MKKDKSKTDILSEEQFTIGMSGASSAPEQDSPGESDDDAASEYELGMGFDPTEAEGDIEAGHTYSPRAVRESIELPSTSRVISSEASNPRENADQKSDTN